MEAQSSLQQLKAYMQHDVVLSSVAYALLYGSLLGTGSVATAYLRKLSSSPL